MTRPKSHFRSLFVVFATLSLGANPLWPGEPLDLVKSAVASALQVLKDPKLKSPDKKQERVERLKEIINPIFD